MYIAYIRTAALAVFMCLFADTLWAQCTGCTSSQNTCFTYNSSDGYTVCSCGSGCACEGMCGGKELITGIDEARSNPQVPLEGIPVFLPNPSNLEGLTPSLLNGVRTEQVLFGDDFALVLYDEYAMFYRIDSRDVFELRNCEGQFPARFRRLPT